MAHKNKALIAQYKAMEGQKKALKEAINTNVAQIYACFAKVLIEQYKHTPAYVEKLFIKTQEEWDALTVTGDIESMVDWCEKTTGVCLRMGDE